MRRFSRRPGAEYCPEARHEAERFLHWRRKNRPLPKGFLAQLTSRRLKRGVFVSVVDLQAAINRFVDEHNRAPKPFSWTADPDAIIAAVKHRHQALDSIHSHVRHFKQQAQEFLFPLVELFSSAAAGHGRRHDHPNDG